MKQFRRAFIAATLIGVGAGFLLQRCTRPPLDLPAVSPSVSTLPVPEGVEDSLSLVGRVYTPDGRPAVGAAVVATTATGVGSDTTDAGGRFELRGLEPGDATVDLVLVGYVPESRAVALPSAEIVEWTLERAFEPVATLPGIERTDLVGRLAPAPEPGDRGYEIWLMPVGDVSEAALAGVVERRTDVDASGEFRFERLAHGAYELALLPRFARGGVWPRLVTVGVDHGPDGGALDVPSRSSSLSGVLVDTDGAPVEGAALLLSPSEDPDRLWPIARSGTDGSFRIPHLVDGSYRLEVRAGDAVLVERLRVPRAYDQRIDLPPLELRSDP